MVIGSEDFIRNFPPMSAVGGRQHPEQGALLNPGSGGGGTGCADGGNGSGAARAAWWRGVSGRAARQVPASRHII